MSDTEGLSQADQLRAKLQRAQVASAALPAASEPVDDLSDSTEETEEGVQAIPATFPQGKSGGSSKEISVRVGLASSKLNNTNIVTGMTVRDLLIREGLSHDGFTVTMGGKAVSLDTPITDNGVLIMVAAEIEGNRL